MLVNRRPGCDLMHAPGGKGDVLVKQESTLQIAVRRNTYNADMLCIPLHSSIVELAIENCRAAT